jgi:hypothetical protein
LPSTSSFSFAQLAGEGHDGFEGRQRCLLRGMTAEVAILGLSKEVKPPDRSGSNVAERNKLLLFIEQTI